MSDTPGHNRRAIGGGISVILVTGLVAAIRFWRAANSALDYVIVAAIVIGSIVGALLLHRFISRHGDEIGEARFPTSNPMTGRSE